MQAVFLDAAVIPSAGGTLAAESPAALVHGDRSKRSRQPGSLSRHAVLRPAMPPPRMAMRRLRAVSPEQRPAPGQLRPGAVRGEAADGVDQGLARRFAARVRNHQRQRVIRRYMPPVGGPARWRPADRRCVAWRRPECERGCAAIRRRSSASRSRRPAPAPRRHDHGPRARCPTPIRSRARTPSYVVIIDLIAQRAPCVHNRL